MVTLRYVADHFEPNAIERLQQLQRQANVQLLAERHGLHCELEQLDLDDLLALVIEAPDVGRAITLLDEVASLGYLDRMWMIESDDADEEEVLAAYHDKALPPEVIFRRHYTRLKET